jgi:hypothetical protein
MQRRGLFAVHAFLVLFFANGPTALAGEKHRLIGTWVVDAAKLSMPHPPRSVTMSLTEVGDGKYKMSVDIIDHEGHTSHGEGIFKPDGAATPAKGSLDVDVVSMTMPSNKILIMGAGIAGRPSSTRVFSLSDDGSHMIETVVHHEADGTPITRVDVWTKK